MNAKGTLHGESTCIKEEIGKRIVQADWSSGKQTLGNRRGAS